MGAGLERKGTRQIKLHNMSATTTHIPIPFANCNSLHKPQSSNTCARALAVSAHWTDFRSVHFDR